MKSPSLIATCAVTVIAWVTMILCLSSYWEEKEKTTSVSNNARAYSLDTEESQKSGSTVKLEQANRKSYGNKWVYLLIAVVAMVSMYLLAFRLWDDWLTAIF